MLTTEQLDEIRQRFRALDNLNDAENPDDDRPAFDKALAHRAWLCAWDVGELLSEVDRLTADLNMRTGQLKGSREYVDQLKREVTEVSVVARRTADESDRLKAELDEHRALFEVQHKRMGEATQRWRDESAERAGVLPDLGELLAWLMGQADTMRAEVADTTRHNDTIASVISHTIGYGGENLGEGVCRLGILLERERRIVAAAKAVDHAWRTENGTGARIVDPLRKLAQALDDLDISEVEATAAARQSVVDTAQDVVEVWRQWRHGQSKQVIPIKALAAAVDVLALTPAASALAGQGQALEHQATQGETGTRAVIEAWPAGRYMMATRASHVLGDVSRDVPDLAVVYSEDDDSYIGNWRTGFGYINVRFPKDSTRELTAQERAKYAAKVVEAPGGFVEPALIDTAATEADGPEKTEEPIDLNDLKQRAEAVAPGATDQLHNLLGCAWGRHIVIPGDMELCHEKADQIVVLHNNGQAATFKLCAKHRDLVAAEISPHTGGDGQQAVTNG